MSDVKPYTIRTDAFEGPLDLLLSLVEKRKLQINEVALSQVADDYLRYLEDHRDFPIEETAQFVLVGSTLVLVKSKSLLPSLTISTDEQQSVAELEARLKTLDRFKTFGRALQARFGTDPLFNRRVVRRVQQATFSPDTHLGIADYHAAVRTVLAHAPTKKQELAKAVVEKVVSLDEMMDDLASRINGALQVSFRDVAKRQSSKVNVIVSFLAMLELVRQGVIRVEQEARFGDIDMHADAVGVPKYG